MLYTMAIGVLTVQMFVALVVGATILTAVCGLLAGLIYLLDKSKNKVKHEITKAKAE